MSSLSADSGHIIIGGQRMRVIFCAVAHGAHIVTECCVFMGTFMPVFCASSVCFLFLDVFSKETAT